MTREFIMIYFKQHAYISLFHMETQRPRLHERRGNFKLCFMYKVVNSTAPSYLAEILSNAVNIDKHYKLRNDDDMDQF